MNFVWGSLLLLLQIIFSVFPAETSLSLSLIAGVYQVVASPQF